MKKYLRKGKLNLAKWSRIRILRPPSGSKQQRGKKPNKNAQVAQLVEQLAFNQLVLGSSPSLRTFLLNQPASTKAGFLRPRVIQPIRKRTRTNTFQNPLAKGLKKNWGRG